MNIITVVDVQVAINIVVSLALFGNAVYLSGQTEIKYDERGWGVFWRIALVQLLTVISAVEVVINKL